MLTSGEIPIGKNLIIDGPGATSLVISGNNNSRIFNVTSGVVTITRVTIKDGASVEGGGIKNSGELALTNVVVSGNKSTIGGGGGIANFGTLTVLDSTISGNTADASGAGIVNDTNSKLTITNSTISGNTANTGTAAAC